jgi:hypothetical protein
MSRVQHENQRYILLRWIAMIATVAMNPEKSVLPSDMMNTPNRTGSYMVEVQSPNSSYRSRNSRSSRICASERKPSRMKEISRYEKRK